MIGVSDDEFKRSLALVRGYLAKHGRIKNRTFRTLTGLSYDQAITFFGRAMRAGALRRIGRGSATHYVLHEK